MSIIRRQGVASWFISYIEEDTIYAFIHAVSKESLCPPEQPDGNFTTCPYPNPEIKEALALGLEYAKRLGSEGKEDAARLEALIAEEIERERFS